MKNIQIGHNIYRVKNSTFDKIEELNEDSKNYSSLLESPLWSFLYNFDKTEKPITIIDRSFVL